MERAFLWAMRCSNVMKQYGLAGFVVGVMALALPALGFAQVEIVPGDAARGVRVIEAKGCTACHAIEGIGGTRAPDLAVRAARLYNPGLLASVMWNHGPTMWREIAGRGGAVPTFSSTEAADLFSYFYSRLYFSVPGDAGRGRAVFRNRGCETCHDTESPGRGNKTGPPVESWARVRDPIEWAERMWNHSESMYDAMRIASIPWPELSTEEMVDLLVYLRNLPTSRSEETEFQIGDPELGRAVFQTSCEQCHSFGSFRSDRVDLLGRTAPATVAGYAAAMWNHAPMMATTEAADLPALDEGAMPDLVAYLFAERYFAEQGDARHGADVYGENNCSVCHDAERIETGAPDLTRAVERYSPITMMRALWNHGPAMLRLFQQRNLYWPVFEGKDMEDLIAYLNSRLQR